MKTLELTPDIDTLYSTYIEDSIDRNSSIHFFIRLLDSIESGYSLAVDGRWGSGKTFFVKQTKLVLDSLNMQSHFSADPNTKNLSERVCGKWISSQSNGNEAISPYVTVYYDAWEHDDDNDPILSLVYETIKQCDTNSEIAKKKLDYKSVFAGLIKLLKGIDLSDFQNVFENGVDLLSEPKVSEKLRKSINDFFCSLLPEKGDRLIIFIDELDRCCPSYAIRLLERIKHYFSNSVVSFVFSINKPELEKTIKSFYGHDFDACRYLDRFFDLQITLPPANMYKYYHSLGVSKIHQDHLVETIGFEVIRQLEIDKSMREISRYLQLIRIAAKRYTHAPIAVGGFEGAKLARMYAYSIITPIALGLKLSRTEDFERFISGDDSSWLEKIVLSDNLSIDVVDFLYEKYEVKDYTTSQKKIRDVYNAVFIKTYETGCESETVIGRAIFDIHIKQGVLNAIGLLSRFSVYE